MSRVRDTSPAGASATAFSETGRQLLHMAMCSFALLLRVLTWWEAAACAAAALAFNLFVLPHVGGRRLYRPADAARGFPLGIALYPLSVLLLILVFPGRPDIVAAAWGVMAIGDGLATIVGSRTAGPRLPWNPEKSVAGTLAFMIGGGAAAVALARWTAPAVQPAPGAAFWVCAPLAAAVVAGLVETYPVRLDDNVSVPAAAAAVLWGASLMSVSAARSSWPDVVAALPAAAAVNAVAAWLGWRVRTVSAAGAAGGAAIGFTVYLSTGFAGWLLLFAGFFSSAATSRLGLERKALLGIDEAHGGRRGPGNALANCGIGAAAGLLSVTSAYREAALLAFVTALIAGASDTVASEIGKAWGRRTFLVPTFKAVKPGTSGAVSVEGTAAGLLAAFALAAAAAGLGLIDRDLVWIAVAGATAGAFAESWLASAFESPGVLNNDVLNLLNTAIGALVALALAGMRAGSR
jgi:uncharacterized protein (TIGR00297 family)